MIIILKKVENLINFKRKFPEKFIIKPFFVMKRNERIAKKVSWIYFIAVLHCCTILFSFANSCHSFIWTFLASTRHKKKKQKFSFVDIWIKYGQVIPFYWPDASQIAFQARWQSECPFKISFSCRQLFVVAGFWELWWQKRTKMALPSAMRLINYFEICPGMFFPIKSKFINYKMRNQFYWDISRLQVKWRDGVVLWWNISF